MRDFRFISLIAIWVSGIGVAWFGDVNPDRMGSANPIAAFWVGAFASVLAVLVFRFLRLGNPALEGVDDRRGKVIHKLHAPVAFLGLVFFFFSFGLSTIDGRALELIGKLPDRLRGVGDHFCPEIEPVDTERPADAQGCELVRRAVELGYADNLGSCGPQESEETAPAFCYLRHRDEPWLHYAWRRFTDAAGGLLEAASPKALAGQSREMQVRGRHLPQLFRAQAQVVGSDARASHHLWVSLPNPRTPAERLNDDYAQRARCLDANHRLEPRPRVHPKAGLRASVEVEHLLGQLLFDTRYEPAAASCREFVIHWDAPIDACEQLQANPADFLNRWGARGAVDRVLDRYALAGDSQEIKKELPGSGLLDSDMAEFQWVRPQRFISFHCYTEELRIDDWRVSLPFELAGHRFTAEQLSVPESQDGTPYIERYGHLASLLTTGFEYTSLAGDALQEAEAAGVSPRRLLRTRDGFFSKLDYLADVDILLGSGWWVLHRDDLLQVYPYHIHLKTFVDVFRRQYRIERGRL